MAYQTGKWLPITYAMKRRQTLELSLMYVAQSVEHKTMNFCTNIYMRDKSNFHSSTASDSYSILDDTNFQNCSCFYLSGTEAHSNWLIACGSGLPPPLQHQARLSAPIRLMCLSSPHGTLSLQPDERTNTAVHLTTSRGRAASISGPI